MQGLTGRRHVYREKVVPCIVADYSAIDPARVRVSPVQGGGLIPILDVTSLGASIRRVHQDVEHSSPGRQCLLERLPNLERPPGGPASDGKAEQLLHKGWKARRRR